MLLDNEYPEEVLDKALSKVRYGLQNPRVKPETEDQKGPQAPCVTCLTLCLQQSNSNSLPSELSNTANFVKLKSLILSEPLLNDYLVHQIQSNI